MTDKTVIILNKERLKREQKQLLAQSKVAKGVEKVAGEVPVDPILAIYPKMVTFGKSLALNFTVEQADEVWCSWEDAVNAALHKDIEVSDADFARWCEHRTFAEAFLRLVRVCHGYDEDGHPPVSAYVGIMDP